LTYYLFVVVTGMLSNPVSFDGSLITC